jgi:predicted transcriptional regulator
MKNYKQKAVERPSYKRDFTPSPVTDYMIRAEKLITFSPDTEILDVVDTLLKHAITGAPIIDNKKKLVGLIDDKDCLKVLFDMAYHNQPVKNTTVTHYMTNTMKTISHRANIMDVADTFLTTKYKRLLVVDDNGELKGQISRQDVLSAIRDFGARLR